MKPQTVRDQFTFPLRLILLGSWSALAALAAHAAPIEFQSPERQVPLLELYTSEGCSSCPPAESWLSRLKEKNGLWTDFVPVAFHVDYWNSLGWRDKWSSQQFSDRQRDYAAAWSAANIYTPEFVLNGREWRNWLGLKGAPTASETKTGVLKVASDDAYHWRVTFIPAAAGAAAFDVNATLLASSIGSDVKAGENSGRHLQHDFAALQLVKQPLLGKDGRFEGAFTLAAVRESAPARLALAVWLTRPGNLESVQAGGGWLPSPGKAQ